MLSSRLVCDVAGVCAVFLLTTLVLSNDHLRFLDNFEENVNVVEQKGSDRDGVMVTGGTTSLPSLDRVIWFSLLFSPSLLPPPSLLI